MERSSSGNSIQLPHARIRFVLQRQGPADQRFIGGKLRGAFGTRLHQRNCVTGLQKCDGCPTQNFCITPKLFSNQAPVNQQAGIQKAGSDAPQPYIIRPPMPHKGDIETAELIIVGHATQYIGEAVACFSLALQHDISGVSYKLLDTHLVDQADQPTDSICETIEYPQQPQRFTLYLDSPTQLKHERQLVNADSFTFQALYMSVLRRISLLKRYYTEHSLELDFKEHKTLASTAQPQQVNLLNGHVQRYSTRTKQSRNAQGIVGKLEFNQSIPDTLWPWLWAGQWIHAGKDTTMGFGRYHITPMNHPA